MELYRLMHDVRVFGFQVKNFPADISKAFDSLVNVLPDGFNRSFYGICRMEDGRMVYRATAEETKRGEAEQYSYQRYVIEKGKYITIPLMNWRNNIPQIREKFQELMKDARVDPTKPCVEWYKNDEEMVCMMKLI